LLTHFSSRILMAYFKTIIKMDADYRRLYWKLAAEVIAERAKTNSGQFLGPEDLTVDAVIRFAAKVDPTVVSSLVIKYLGPTPAEAKAVVEKKKKTSSSAKVTVPVMKALARHSEMGEGATALPSVMEFSETTDEHMDVVNSKTKDMIKAMPKSTIAGCKPINVPTDIVNISGFAAIFPGRKEFGALENALHDVSDCSICAEIGPRIGARQMRVGNRMKSKRTLLSHEKVYALALHHALQDVRNPEEFRAASSTLAVGAGVLMKAYDKKLNTVLLTKVPGGEHLNPANVSYSDLVSLCFKFSSD